MNNKLGYITSIDTDLIKASSIQVGTNIACLKENLKHRFYSFVITNNTNNNRFIDHNIKLSSKVKGKYRKFVTPFVFFPTVIKNKITHIYTREIWVSLFYLSLGWSVVYEVHEFRGSYFYNSIFKLLKYFNRLKIVTVSKRGVSEVRKLTEDKIPTYCLPNGVDLKLYNNIENDLRLEPKSIVYTGSLHKGKDIDIIYRCANVCPNYIFYIIGGSSKEIDFFQRKYDKINNVRHLQSLNREETIRYQKAAHALIYPVSPENEIVDYTCPIKIMEYMASGKPIIGNALGAVKDILNKENCYVFNLEIKESISDAFRKMECDISSHNSLITTNALNYAKKNFNINDRAQKIASICDIDI